MYSSAIVVAIIMDDLIFTLLSKREPHVGDVIALLNQCLSEGRSAYRSMSELDDALSSRGERVVMRNIGANGAFCLQIHNDGTPFYLVDLFMPRINGASSPRLYVKLSYDWCRIERVFEFVPVNTRNGYDTWCATSVSTYVPLHKIK
jgi:hypothetical protein